MGGDRTGTIINARLDEAKTTYEVTFLTRKSYKCHRKEKKSSHDKFHEDIQVMRKKHSFPFLIHETNVF